MRLLGGWLHGPPDGRHGHLSTGQSLWRIRVRVSDQPGQLESLARNLAKLDANILTVHVHHLDGGSLDESDRRGGPGDVTGGAVACRPGRGRPQCGHLAGFGARADRRPQTKALTLASRVAADPSELPLSIAELLGAQYVDSLGERPSDHGGVGRDPVGRG